MKFLVQAVERLFGHHLSNRLEQALSRGPNPGELVEFTALWRGLPKDGFSANRLIHRLIDTRAFGVP